MSFPDMQKCDGCGWLYYARPNDSGLCGVCQRELGMGIDTIESLAVDLRVRKAQAQPRDEADYLEGYEPTVFDRVSVGTWDGADDRD